MNVYFTFKLNDVTYAIDVKSVKEVLTYEPITPVPRSKEYMKGVMNIRGTVISVIDFRILFNMAVKENSKATSIVVTEVQLNDEPLLSFGFIADSVEGVRELDGEIEKDQSNSGLSYMNSSFIKKLGKIKDNFILILDMEAILQHIEQELDNIKTK